MKNTMRTGMIGLALIVSLGGCLGLCWTAAGGIAPRGMILQNPSILHKAIPDFVEARMAFLDCQAMGPAVTCPVTLFSAEEGFAPLLIGCSIPGTCPQGALVENAHDTRVYYAATDAMLDGQMRPGFDVGVWSDGTSVKPVETLLQQP